MKKVAIDALMDVIAEGLNQDIASGKPVDYKTVILLALTNHLSDISESLQRIAKRKTKNLNRNLTFPRREK